MEAGAVQLVHVDGSVLSELVEVAIQDTHPNDVTPPLTPCDEWTPERVEWLRSFHTDRRGGLAETPHEATWAVTSSGKVVGAVRLKATEQTKSLEAGIWLRRSARRNGMGQAAVAALIAEATAAGAAEVSADTAGDNLSAVAILRSLGFELMEHGAVKSVPPGRPGGPAVRAVLRLQPAD